MASFPLSDIGRVSVHPAKGISWSKSTLIIKRLAFPKGAIPAHLVDYTRKFTDAVKECRSVMAGKTGADKVVAFNGCIGGKLKRK